MRGSVSDDWRANLLGPHHSTLSTLAERRSLVDSKYKPCVTRNGFATLNPVESLLVIGISLAANDLVSNVEAMGIIPEGENTYFFYSSIAIVREVAKLVARIQESTLSQKFSAETRSSFKELAATLVPYHDTAIVKSVLKPIRDVTFHYDLTKSNTDGSWDSILDKICRLDQLDVRLVSDDCSLRGQRYTFADRFRTDYVNQFLTRQVVSEISAVSVRIGVFVDSVLTDLVHELKRGEESHGGSNGPGSN